MALWQMVCWIEYKVLLARKARSNFHSWTNFPSIQTQLYAISKRRFEFFGKHIDRNTSLVASLCVCTSFWFTFNPICGLFISDKQAQFSRLFITKFSGIVAKSITLHTPPRDSERSVWVHAPAAKRRLRSQNRNYFSNHIAVTKGHKPQRFAYCFTSLIVLLPPAHIRFDLNGHKPLKPGPLLFQTNQLCDSVRHSY